MRDETEKQQRMMNEESFLILSAESRQFFPKWRFAGNPFFPFR